MAMAAETSRARILIRSLSKAVAVPGLNMSTLGDGDGLGLGLGVWGVKSIIKTVFKTTLSSPTAK